MGRSNDQIEADVVNAMDQRLLAAMLARVGEQDSTRGRWPRLRGGTETPMGMPWPTPGDPTLSFLVEKAAGCLGAGMDPAAVLTQLAVHAWFEGGIEGYDAGQGDARSELVG